MLSAPAPALTAPLAYLLPGLSADTNVKLATPTLTLFTPVHTVSTCCLTNPNSIAR